MKKRLIILSGAGLSAESGISTFRDEDGLWDNHSINEICNITTWKQNFNKVHNFYDGLRVALESKKPNEMHLMIAKWKQKFEKNCIVITQNIDDLLERSYVNDVIHLHGELKKLWCMDCKNIFEIGYSKYDLKKCEKCGSKWIKPYIVFFGEMAPNYEYLYEVFSSLTKNDMVIVIGTSGKVISVNGLLWNTQSYNILNNLKPESYISEQVFKECIYMPATKATKKIDELVNRFFQIC